MPPPPQPGTVPPANAVGGSNPVLAAILGFIPGVGAMYNGEYAKGFVHALIFATLIWAASNVSEFFGPLIALFIFYMVFEAYQTAKARRLGLPAPDPFGLNSWLSNRVGIPMTPPPPVNTPPGAVTVAPAETMAPPDNVADGQNIPVGAYILIGLGVVFLMNTFGWFHMGWLFRQFWPVILIALGVHVLIRRTRTGC
jgi:hypothetical protein